EIQTVSATLAELIQDISAAAKRQALSAGRVSKTMNVIQDITTQTTGATKNTATSIGELAEMAVELREFVTGFKLPANLTRQAAVAASGPTLEESLAALEAQERAQESSAGATEPEALARSEEHTSELQSRENLVCRLLLEKKKSQKKIEYLLM